MQIISNDLSVFPLVNATFYTGTRDQPHNVILFHKSNTTLSVHHYGPAANGLGGILLIGHVVGIIRIKNAVKEIFTHFNNPHAPHDWKKHVFHNIVRGLLEIIPGFGLGIIIYDTSYKMTLFQDMLLKELSAEKGECYGVMRDGEIIACLPYMAPSNPSSKPLSDKEKLDHFTTDFWAKMRQKEEQNKTFSLSMEEVIQSLRT